MGGGRGVGFGCGRLFEFEWKEEGWALTRGWALINFSCPWDGCLFEVGANSRLSAYSNKYGIWSRGFQQTRTSFTGRAPVGQNLFQDFLEVGWVALLLPFCQTK